jgi:hypothetical protein
VAAVIGAGVGIVAAYLLGLPMWVGVVVFAVGFALGMFVLLRALDAEESRNQP